MFYLVVIFKGIIVVLRTCGSTHIQFQNWRKNAIRCACFVSLISAITIFGYWDVQYLILAMKTNHLTILRTVLLWKWLRMIQELARFSDFLILYRTFKSWFGLNRGYYVVLTGSSVEAMSIHYTVRIRFKKLPNKKEIQFKEDLLVTKMQITVIDDSK